MFVLNPADIEEVAESMGVARSELEVPSSIILTFSRAVLDELKIICQNLKEWKWKGEMFSPYSSSRKSLKGSIDDLHNIAVFMPPMGASPLAAFCEELIYFGAEVIFLICASWGLGEKYLSKGQIQVPSFAIGFDGTSIHYGNRNYNIQSESKAFNALITALNKLGANWKKGGVGACEAIYCITPEMIDEFRKQGCLSMENGEVASLFSLAHKKKIPIGVLLQPYIDLEEGWSISYLDEEYSEICKVQARTAIEALKSLHSAQQRKG
jgi:uridine phosphorylase